MTIKEIMVKMAETLDAAKAEEDFEKKSALMDEFDALKAQKELAEREEAAEKAFAEKKMEEADEAEEKEAELDSYEKSVKEFAAAARRGFKTYGGMSEGVNADGGYTVPEDISTKIEELREAKASLIDYVAVENVKTMSGARTFKKRSQLSGFSSVAEAASIGAMAIPQFDRYTYTITKYAGFLPVTNELLDDSDANIVSVLTEWIADESRVTRNKLILAALDDKYTRATDPEDEVSISSLDDIKNVLNVTLGQAFKPYSIIITNDSGLQWLDTLVDGIDRYMLQPDPTNPMKQRLCAGTTTVPVVVIPNADLPDDDDNGTPFYIGDFKEAIVFFDRKQLSIKTSDTAAIGTSSAAVNAFAEDLTVFRAIEREDVVCRDDAAYVKGFYKAQ